MNELFAIEPTAFADHHDLKFLLGRFGFSEGRFVAEYPKRWLRLVFEHLSSLPDVERSRAIALLHKYKEDRLLPTGSPYAQERTWIENAQATKESGQVADLIVAREHGGAFPTPDVDIEYFHDRGGTTANVLSTAEGYANVAEILLRLSHEVAIVDPYIHSRPTKGYQRVFESMAKHAINGKCRSFVIFSLDDGATYDQTEPVVRQFFASVCKQGISVKYVVLRDRGSEDADNHGRFIISARGAMQFDKGFEEENSPRLRKVSILDSPMHQHLYSQYLEDQLPFDKAFSLTLPASRRD